MTETIRIKSLTLGEGIPAVCVPLTATEREGVLTQAREAALAGADLVEWRADFYDRNEPEALSDTALALDEALGGSIPVLFTIRTAAEGGQRACSYEAYRAACLAAARTGAVSLVDVEAVSDPERKRELIAELQSCGVKVVASNHDFHKTDDEQGLLRRFQVLNESGADILKLAVMPESPEDVTRLMEVVRRVRETLTEKPLIAMSMGELGVETRIRGEEYGSCLTFGTVGAASAPGQIPLEVLRQELLKVHREVTRRRDETP